MLSQAFYHSDYHDHIATCTFKCSVTVLNTKGNLMVLSLHPDRGITAGESQPIALQRKYAWPQANSCRRVDVSRVAERRWHIATCPTSMDQWKSLFALSRLN
jgi:hypothetical protein